MQIDASPTVLTFNKLSQEPTIMKPKAKKAFSVIELAVVVTIIGIISLLGFPASPKMKDRTIATVTANDLESVYRH